MSRSLRADKGGTITRILDDTRQFEALFGGNLAAVDPRLLRVAMHTAPVPRWLHGATRLEDLPRCSAATEGDALPCGGAWSDTLVERIIFVVDYLSDPWWLTEHNFIFASEQDAVHYTLRWVR